MHGWPIIARAVLSSGESSTSANPLELHMCYLATYILSPRDERLISHARLRINTLDWMLERPSSSVPDISAVPAFKSP